jgi:light-harvesting complex 1 beta chain
MTTHIQSGLPGARATPDFRGWMVLFALSFVAFMVIALIGQLTGLQWRAWLPGAEGVKSVFGGVKAAVYTFMSHLT